jgi:hypothetical protein
MRKSPATIGWLKTLIVWEGTKGHFMLANRKRANGQFKPLANSQSSKQIG